MTHNKNNIYKQEWGILGQLLSGDPNGKQLSAKASDPNGLQDIKRCRGRWKLRALEINVGTLSKAAPLSYDEEKNGRPKRLTCIFIQPLKMSHLSWN